MAREHRSRTAACEAADGALTSRSGIRIIAQLLYGSGLRLMEALRLRVKDIDFEYAQIIVRDGKGGKDRITVLPDAVVRPLEVHLLNVREQHEAALRRGYADVQLPHALERKYAKAHAEWAWQYAFPAARPSRDPRSGVVRRRTHHGATSMCKGLRAVRAPVR